MNTETATQNNPPQMCSGGQRNNTCSATLSPYLLGNVRYCGGCQREVRR